MLSLSDEGDVRKVIAALTEHGFFDEGVGANNNEISRLHDVSLEMTLEKLVKHLNVQDEGQVKVLRKVLQGKS